jgi:hypothetical protein
VFENSLAYIPKGVLEKIKEHVSNICPGGGGRNGSDGIPLVRWKGLVIPKGGWGLKNIHLFGKILGNKNYVESSYK